MKWEILPRWEGRKIERGRAANHSREWVIAFSNERIENCQCHASASAFVWARLSRLSLRHHLFCPTCKSRQSIGKRGTRQKSRQAVASMEAVAGSIRFSLFNRLISHQTVFLSQLAKQIMGGLLLRLVICVQVLIGTVAVGARPPATAMYVFPPPVTFPSRGVGELSIPKIWTLLEIILTC